MDLLFARWQMGLSLAFHIIFAIIGMAMPVMMVAAEGTWLRTGRAEYFELARRWGARNSDPVRGGRALVDRDPLRPQLKA
jgi:cytochrome bd-type quinol oxidase subunit 1